MSVNKNRKVYKLDAVNARYSLIGIIFKYLKAKELAKVSRVCRAWQEEVFREELVRCYYQKLRFHHDIDNLSDKLDIIPYVSLLLYKSSTSFTRAFSARIYSLNIKILERFKAQLPNKTLVLRVDMCLSTDDVDQFEDPPSDFKFVPNSEILGLFFPSVEGRLRVDVAWVDLSMNLSRFRNSKYEEYSRNAEVNRFANELGLRSCEHPKMTILLLTDGAHAEALKLLRKRPKRDGQRIIWAGIYSQIISSGNHSDKSGHWQNSAALRFSGPSVESCSTFIYIHASRDEIKSKLHKLKEQVQHKRHNIGLFYSIKCVEEDCAHFYHPCCNSREMMYNLKDIFPKIRFNGFFKNEYIKDIENFYSYIPDRSNVKHAFDEELLKYFKYYTSIIIISYD